MKGEQLKRKIIIRLFTIIVLMCIFWGLLNGNVETLRMSEKQLKNETLPINQENIHEQVTIQSEENNDALIGTLEIKKIDMRGIVKEGSTNDVLEDYIGHIENTPKYDGNVCLAAHNRGNQYSYFSRINELENGDEIIYTTRFGTETYVVNRIQEIDEQDWTLLKNTNENKVTLITCITDKREKRLCVQGTKINT